MVDILIVFGFITGRCGEVRESTGGGESWICHKDMLSPQGLEEESEDKLLNMVYYRSRSETGELEVEYRKENKDHIFNSLDFPLGISG